MYGRNEELPNPAPEESVGAPGVDECNAHTGTQECTCAPTAKCAGADNYYMVTQIEPRQS
jgi:hypothetical protein